MLWQIVAIKEGHPPRPRGMGGGMPSAPGWRLATVQLTRKKFCYDIGNKRINIYYGDNHMGDHIWGNSDLVMGDEVRVVREERVERLVSGILGVMKGHYEEGPIERGRVFEVLEALAWVWVITLGPLGKEAREYFLGALGRRAVAKEETIKCRLT